MASHRAVILVSGGLDSATTLAIARSQGFECYALSVDITELPWIKCISLAIRDGSLPVFSATYARF